MKKNFWRVLKELTVQRKSLLFCTITTQPFIWLSFIIFYVYFDFFNEGGMLCLYCEVTHYQKDKVRIYTQYDVKVMSIPFPSLPQNLKKKSEQIVRSDCHLKLPSSGWLRLRNVFTEKKNTLKYFVHSGILYLCVRWVYLSRKFESDHSAVGKIHHIMKQFGVSQSLSYVTHKNIYITNFTYAYVQYTIKYVIGTEISHSNPVTTKSADILQYSFESYHKDLFQIHGRAII